MNKRVLIIENDHDIRLIVDYILQEQGFETLSIPEPEELSDILNFRADVILLDEFVKRRAKIATGRLLDDVAPFDRAFRLISARRNVYVWVLAGGLLLGAFSQSYAIICCWAAVTAAVHLVRSVWICNGSRRRVVDCRA